MSTIQSPPSTIQDATLRDPSRPGPAIQKPAKSDPARPETNIITDLDEAMRLVPEWWALLDRWPGASIYDTPEFVLASYRHLIGPTGTPLLVTFRQKGNLIGLMPLYQHPTKIYGLPFSGISMVASLQGDCPTIVGPDRPLLWRALYHLLTDDMMRWDVLTLAEQGMEDHELIRMLRLDARFRLFQWSESHRYLSDTEVGFDDFFARLSSSSRTEIKRKQKKNEQREQPFRLDQHAEVDSDTEILQLLDRYLAIERKTWKLDAGIGIGEKQEYVDFYADLLCGLAKKKIASFWFLRDGDKDIASLIGYHVGQTLYMAQTTFDPEYAEYSPGLLANRGLLEYACQHPAIRRYDPLATPIDQGRPRHKTVWSTHRDPIPTRKLFVFRKSGLIGFIGWIKQSGVADSLQRLRSRRFLRRA